MPGARRLHAPAPLTWRKACFGPVATLRRPPIDADADGRGLLAVNVMRALSACAASVPVALEEGIDAIVVGAGSGADALRQSKVGPGADA